MLTVKNVVFWYMTPHSLLEICICSGGTCCLVSVGKFLPGQYSSVYVCVLDSVEMGNIYIVVYSSQHAIKMVFPGGK